VADEVHLQLVVDGPPAYVMDEWRRQPPAPLREFELADQAVASLDYVQRYYDWPQKLLIVTTLGFALLFRGFLRSTFRLTARFDEQGTRTRVTLVGTAHPSARQQLVELAT
jgi:hypothetical protein